MSMFSSVRKHPTLGQRGVVDVHSLVFNSVGVDAACIRAAAASAIWLWRTRD